MEKGQRSPVKFATLVFFEEFNGASRCRKSDDRGQRAEVSWLLKNILAGLSHFFTSLASYPQYNLSSMA
jgi:hypothetical protein